MGAVIGSVFDTTTRLMSSPPPVPPMPAALSPPAALGRRCAIRRVTRREEPLKPQPPDEQREARGGLKDVNLEQHAAREQHKVDHERVGVDQALSAAGLEEQAEPRAYVQCHRSGIVWRRRRRQTMPDR